MKKAIISVLAAISVLVAFSACQKEQKQAEETPKQEVKEGTYTLTVQATKDPATKALDLVDGVFTATWADGETVTVYNATKGVALDGTLSPQSFGNATTFLSGSLTGTIEPNDWLELWFYGDPLNGHRGQDGSVSNLGDHEIAMASLEVQSISNGVITPKAAVVFVNQQSIVKFTLKNGDADISANNVTIWAESKQLDGAANDAVDGELKITPGGASVIYVSLQNKSMAADSYAVIATDADGNKYVCRQSGALFEYGKYYEITLKMTKLSSSYTIAGNAGCFSSSYAPTDTNNDMALCVDGLFRKSYSGSSVQNWVEFKVCENHAWAKAYPSDNHGQHIGSFEFTVVFNPISHDITIIDSGSYLVYGTPASLFTSAWSTDEIANLMVANTGIYSKTYEDVPVGTYEFKVLKDRNVETTYPSENAKVIMANSGDLTIQFNPSGNVVSYSIVYDEDPYRLYVHDKGLAEGTKWGSSRKAWIAATGEAGEQYVSVGTETIDGNTYNYFDIKSSLVGKTIDFYYQGENDCEIGIKNIAIASGTKAYYFFTDGYFYSTFTDTSNPTDVIDSSSYLWVQSYVSTDAKALGVIKIWEWNKDGALVSNVWPGDELVESTAKYDGGRWYYYTNGIISGCTGLLFNWNNGASQTGNIEGDNLSKRHFWVWSTSNYGGFNP